jgi:hypothetical protein
VPVLLRQILLLLTIFAVVTAIASAAGAINLGTAMTFGQVAFGAALVALMLRVPPGSRDQGDEPGSDAQSE